MIRYMIPVAFVVCGCFPSEGLMNSQACVKQHAQKQMTNLNEIARLTAETPISERMAELLRENAESAARLDAWADLTQSHIGRAAAPPDILTQQEVASQAIYRSEIEARAQLRNALGLNVPGIGNGSGNGIVSVLAGGGPFALISGILGLYLKKKAKQADEMRDQNAVSTAAAVEAMNLIRTSPDPQLKKRASEEPNLLRLYADQKMAQYDTRIMRIERGIRGEGAPSCPST